MSPCRGGRDPAPGSTGEQPLPYQERLGDLLHGLALLADGDGEGGQPDGTAAEQLEQGFEHGPVEPVEPAPVHLVHLQGGTGHLAVDHAVGPDLRVVPDPAQQAVGDARGAAGAAGDLGGAGGVDLHVEEAGGAVNHAFQLLGGVELHVPGEAEAVAQGRGEQAGAGRRPDEGERRQLEGDGGGPGPLADDHVDAEVLHGHVQHLLGGPGHAVDLVEEEDLALLEGGQDRGEVAGVLDGGAGGDPDGRAHLGGDDHG